LVEIVLRDAVVEFPVFNAVNRSLKNKVIAMTTGGVIARRVDGHVIVRGLDGISLEIREGDRVGIIGHNGAGKTTLLRVLSGIYKPSRGSVSISGETVSLINISLGIDNEATGRDNIRLRGAIMGIDPREVDRRFDEIAEFSGLGDFLDLPVRTYSTGMQLRLAFSVSTMISPEILIMDEWLSTGDEDFRKKADKRLRGIVDNTKILILASHNYPLLKRNCRRLLWLEHGKIKMDGPIDEVAPLYFGGIAKQPVSMD
jgi:lipopolysaccharide transport system ATP-binding protein